MDILHRSCLSGAIAMPLLPANFMAYMRCRAGDAEEELLTLVSHEDATPEGCLAGLQAALAAPGGARMAR